MKNEIINITDKGGAFLSIQVSNKIDFDKRVEIVKPISATRDHVKVFICGKWYPATKESVLYSFSHPDHIFVHNIIIDEFIF